MAKITVDLITSKEFSLENRGYDRREVDSFLDDICEEMERMEEEIKDLRQKTTVVRPAEPAEGPSAKDESSFREILEMAQKVKEETIRKAREDAEAIRTKAENEASERLDGLSAKKLPSSGKWRRNTAAGSRRCFRPSRKRWKRRLTYSDRPG